MFIKFYIIVLVSALCAFCACTSLNQDETLARIKALEYSRSAAGGVFDQYIGNGSLEVKTAVIDAIAKIQDPIHLTSLKKLLVRPDRRYIEKVVFALGQIHTISSVEILENLYIQNSYSPYRRQIIKALGKTESSRASEFLLAYLNTCPDSLLDVAIISLALLSPRDSIQTGVDRQLCGFLTHAAEGVSSAAAYFYSRHPDSLAASALIRARLPINTSGHKYRLRALDRILSRYGTNGIDTLLIDSLQAELTNRHGTEQFTLDGKYLSDCPAGKFSGFIVYIRTGRISPGRYTASAHGCYSCAG